MIEQSSYVERVEEGMRGLSGGECFQRVMALGLGLPPDALNRMLEMYWSLTESPSAYGTGRLVALFERAGFVTDAPDVPPPLEPMTVFRGVPATGKARGLSWTPDEHKGGWFARRGSILVPGIVYAAEIDPQHVLGIFHERGEAEVVVNPRRLRRLRQHAVADIREGGSG